MRKISQANTHKNFVPSLAALAMPVTFPWDRTDSGPMNYVRSCEGFRMPAAAGDGAAHSGGRRPKAFTTPDISSMSALLRIVPKRQTFCLAD